MKGSFFLGRYFKIKVFIHWTFLLLVLWLVIYDFQRGMSWTAIAWHIVFVLVLFLCVTLHEFGHALAARYYNYNTRDITLLPIGGLARLEQIPEKPFQEFVVAIAGPAVNFVIAALLFLGMLLVGQMPDFTQLGLISASNFLLTLMFANAFIGVFNLIPAFPMDGGRILRALLGYKFPYHVATRIAVSVGQIFAILFVLIGIMYSNFILALIGIIVYFGARSEVSAAETRYLVKGYRVKDLMMHNFLTLQEHDPISKAVKLLLDGQSHDFIIMDDGQVAGTLNRNELVGALHQFDSKVAVKQVMNREINYLSPEMKITDVLDKYRTAPSLMPVIQNGELLGALDVENIMEFVRIHEALEK